MARRHRWTHPSVQRLLASADVTGTPEQVIRTLARQRVTELEALGWEGPPYDMEVFASLCGFRPQLTDVLTDDQDACITLEKMLVNGNKPGVRQRFSIGHEIGHTLFPDFQSEVNRMGPHWRRERETHSEVERLCQIAASEFLMPHRAFIAAMDGQTPSISTVLSLAEMFDASNEATAHRLVDLYSGKIVVVYATLKWKPTESLSMQQPTFDFPGFGAPPRKLRVSYAVSSPSCGTLFLPPDKSLPDGSVAYQVWHRASAGGADPRVAATVEDWTSIGKVGKCFVEAIPLPVNTDPPQSVLCLLRPLD